MGKGSERRPMKVSRKVFEDNWIQAFGVVEIIVNGKRVKAKGFFLTFDEIADLAGITHGPGNEPSCTYNCKQTGRSGILVPAHGIGIRKGMSFSLVHTGNA